MRGIIGENSRPVHRDPTIIVPATFTIVASGPPGLTVRFDGEALPLTNDRASIVVDDEVAHWLTVEAEGDPGAAIGLAVESTSGYRWDLSDTVGPDGRFTLSHRIPAPGSTSRGNLRGGGDDWPGPRRTRRTR